jgi:hypothetical protein
VRRSDIRPGVTYEGRGGPPREVVSLVAVDWGGTRGRTGVRYLHPGEKLHSSKRGCLIEVFARWALREACVARRPA